MLTPDGWTVKCRLTIVIKKTSGHKALQSEVKHFMGNNLSLLWLFYKVEEP